MSDKIIEVEGILKNVILRRNTRIKRLSIKVGTHSGVVVCIPRSVTNAQAVAFLQQKKEWVLKHLQNIKYCDSKIPNQVSLATTVVIFQETEHNIPKIKEKDGVTVLSIPVCLLFEEKEQLKRQLLEKVLRVEAKSFLTKRVAELASIHGFQYGKLSFRNQKTLWGSCSYHNNISLNIQLMRLPLHLIDYVIIHELCHTVHKNHSAKFWLLVYEKIGNSLYSCKKEMTKRRIEL